MAWLSVTTDRSLEVETCEGTEEGFFLDIVRLDVEETQDTSSFANMSHRDSYIPL